MPNDRIDALNGPEDLRIFNLMYGKPQQKSSTALPCEPTDEPLKKQASDDRPMEVDGQLLNVDGQPIRAKNRYPGPDCVCDDFIDEPIGGYRCSEFDGYDLLH